MKKAKVVGKKLHPAWIVLIAIGALVVLFLLLMWGNYNGLVSADETVNEKWSNVQTAYQRRADLIPNLVDTVQEYRDYEQETLTQITALRSQATQAKQAIAGATTPEQMQAASKTMGSVLSGLNIVVEKYPNLKASESFLSLQDELAGTENRIKVERDNYNKAVKAMNKKVRMFPSNMYANMFGFEKAEMFEADEGTDVAPDAGNLFDS